MHFLVIKNYNYFKSISEWSEDTLLLIHRVFISIASLVMTSVYCSRGHSICRPQPMFFYFTNSWQETHFQRDLISLIFIASFLLTILVLQVFIEIKKCKFKSEAEKAKKAADAAKRSLEEAKLKLINQETLSVNIEMNQNSNPPLPSQLPILDTLNSEINASPAITIFSTDLKCEKQSNSNALKLARAVTLFALLPASIFLTLFTLENINEWRPHGVTIAVMIAFGMIIPILSFVVNLRMRKFAVNYLSNNFFNWMALFRSNRVEPSIITLS